LTQAENQEFAVTIRVGWSVPGETFFSVKPEGRNLGRLKREGRAMLESFKLAFAAGWGIIAAGLSFLLLVGAWDWLQELLARIRAVLRSQKMDRSRQSGREPGQ
jgi:hypothetical protein